MNKKIYITDHEQSVTIGRKGDKEVDALIMDLSYHAENYGKGRAELWFTPPDKNEEFPVLMIQNENVVTFIIDESITRTKGDAEIRLRYFPETGGRKILPKVNLKIKDGIKDEIDPPEPMEDIIEDALELIGKLKQMIDSFHLDMYRDDEGTLVITGGTSNLSIYMDDEGTIVLK